MMTSIDEASDLEHDGDGEDAGPVHPGPEVNIGHFERGASLTLGLALVALALGQRRVRGAFTYGLLGTYLSWRGATGHCAVYDALDTGSAEDGEDERLDAGGHDDVSMAAAATIACSPDVAYTFFRRLENLPRFMAFVDSVQPLDETRSRWAGRSPSGSRLEWEAEILEDRPGDLLAWRSVAGAPVHHAGAVRFRPAPGDRGTEVRLEVEFEWPEAPLGRALAHVLGAATEYVAEEDLRRLKQILEAGETATTRGQPQCSPSPGERR
jgi:uncharacterized membrane protein